MKNEWMKFVGAGALALVVAAGCTGADQTGDGQTADSVPAAKMQNGVDQMQDGAAGAAGAAGNKIENGAEAVGNAAANAGQVVVNGANNAMAGAKNLDDAATITPMLKTAFGANAALKGSNINVSTTDKNIMLDGTVKSPAQKMMAGNIAKQKAPGYMIKNNLKVVS